MYNGHNDKCPICRAPRLGSSIADLGWRQPQSMTPEWIEARGGVPGFAGTIFFPVDPFGEGEAEIPMVEMRRVRLPESASSGDQASVMASILQDITSDPVMQAALDGLRNPGSISVSAFLANVGEARRARNASTRETRAEAAIHEAIALVEGRGD